MSEVCEEMPKQNQLGNPEEEGVERTWSVLDGEYIDGLTDLDESQLWDIEKRSRDLTPALRVRTRALETLNWAFERTQPDASGSPEAFQQARSSIKKSAMYCAEAIETYGDSMTMLEIMRGRAPELAERFPPLLQAIHEIYSGRTFSSLPTGPGGLGVGDSRRLAEAVIYDLYVKQKG